MNAVQSCSRQLPCLIEQLFLQEDFDEEANPDGFTLVGSVPEAPVAAAGVLHRLQQTCARTAHCGKARPL